VKNVKELAISLVFDIADFTIGRIPGFGTLFDIGGAFIGYKLWGPLGLAQLWEVADVTDQIDGFVPTLTLLGLYVTYVKK